MNYTFDELYYTPFLACYRSDGSRVWANAPLDFIDKQTPTSLTVLPDGRGVFVYGSKATRGSNPLTRIIEFNAETGAQIRSTTLSTNHLAVHTNRNGTYLISGFVQQRGQTWGVWSDSNGVNWHRTAKRMFQVYEFQRVVGGISRDRGTYSFPFESADYRRTASTPILYRDGEIITTLGLNVIKFMLNRREEPFLAMARPVENRIFKGVDTTGRARFGGTAGSRIVLARFSATGLPVFWRTHLLANNRPSIRQVDLFVVGLQPDYDLNFRWYSHEDVVPQIREFQYRYDGTPGFGGDTVRSRVNFDFEEEVGGFVYRTGSWSRYGGTHFGKYRAGQADPIWDEAEFSGALFRFSEHTVFMPQTGSVRRRRNSDGELIDPMYLPSSLRGFDLVGDLRTGKLCAIGEGRNGGELWFYDQSPLPQDDAFSTRMGVTLNGTSVLANDQISGGLSPRLVRAPSNGTAALNPDGTFRYTPRAGWTGADSFDYELVRPGVSPSRARVAIRVLP